MSFNNCKFKAFKNKDTENKVNWHNNNFKTSQKNLKFLFKSFYLIFLNLDIQVFFMIFFSRLFTAIAIS